jgi:protocatechuate 3,4-dioxygenase beta subunit
VITAGSLETILTTKTDLSGTFSLEVEQTEKPRFQVRLSKEGYLKRASSIEAAKDSTTAGSEGEAGGRYLLYRTNKISGRIADVELQQPAPGVKVSVLQGMWRLGQRLVIPAGGAATTDADGRFQLTGLAPGEYFLEVQSSAGIDERITIAPSKEDVEKVELGYTRSYWPGSDLNSAIPVVLTSGGDYEVGEIRLSKRPICRAHVSLLSAGCSAEEIVSVMLDQSGGGLYMTRARAQVPCNKEILITGLQPGPYQLEAVIPGAQRDQRRTAHADIEAADRNLHIDLVLERGVDVAGKITVPSEGTKAVLRKLKVGLSPTTGLASASDTPGTVDSGGVFNLVNYLARDYRVEVSGLPEGLLVKQILYNGGLMADGILRLERDASSHSLTVVLSDKPATVFGQVAGRDGPMKAARVVLVRGAARPDDAGFAPKMSKADDRGGYRFGGIAPGEYRLFAVPPDTDLNPQDVLQKLRSRAKQLKLDEGGVQNIALEVSAP